MWIVASPKGLSVCPFVLLEWLKDVSGLSVVRLRRSG